MDAVEPEYVAINIMCSEPIKALTRTASCVSKLATVLPNPR
jgi:hypothetical protein